MERLIALRWLELLHPSLTNHVPNVFALDLQTKSRKDLQPRINEQNNDLLFQVHNKSEDTSVDLSFTRFSNNRFNNSSGNSYGGYKRSSNEYRNSSSKYNGNRNNFYKGAPNRPKPKTCSACRSVKEPFIGHDIYNSPNIAAADRADLLKSFSLEVDDECYDEQDSADEKEQHNANVKVTEDGFSSVHVQRVGIVESPHFNLRIKKTMLTMVLDTGATGSMISLDLCKLTNLDVYPTTQRAILADGDSHLAVVGEVHTTITMNSNVTLPLSALVVTKLKAGLIVGMAFMKQHNVAIDIPNNALLVQGNTVPFNNQPGNP